MSNDSTFYVYAYVRSRSSKNGETGTPYYIGKGTGTRAFSPNHKVKSPTDRNNVVFLGVNLTEDQAFAAEKHFIQYYGRMDLGQGCLRNRTDGGEGMAGHVPGEDTRLKLRNAMTGRQFSQRSIRRMSDARKEVLADPAARRRMSEARKGRKKSKAARLNMKKAALQRAADPIEHQRLIGMAEMRKQSGFSREHRLKLSEAAKRRYTKSEEREKASDYAKRRWLPEQALVPEASPSC
jgi:hypothetical protein